MLCSRAGECSVEGDYFVFEIFCLTALSLKANACSVFSQCRTPELDWADAILMEKVVYLTYFMKHLLLPYQFHMD